MNPSANFSDELQKMYQMILMQQHNIAYASMIAAFSSATAAVNQNFASNPSSTSFGPLSFSNAADIPREDIECDAEAIVVKNLRGNLTKIQTNLNGLHGNEFGFREVIGMASIREAYPICISPNPSLVQHSNSNYFGSPIGMLQPMKASTPKSSDETAENDWKKVRYEVMPGRNEPSTSSHRGRLMMDFDRHLMIDLDESAASTSSMLTHRMKIEKPYGPTEDEEMSSNEETDDDEFNPVKLRIDRLRSIQTKKPKFNVENLELVYHSNMARSFPGSQIRTEHQQALRDRNTISARISRLRTKAYERMLEDKSVEATTENITMKRKIACLRVYANGLMTLNGFPKADFTKMWEANVKDVVASATFE